MVALISQPVARQARPDTAAIGRLATACLKLEVMTYPKPGLVSHVDSGAHRDMDAALMCRSADSLTSSFIELAEAGANNLPMPRLRAIGLAAERTMMMATGGVNAHRGAIFGMGLLCAAAGYREAFGVQRTLGAIVAAQWGPGIVAGPVACDSHGALAARRFSVGGARKEAASGFPAIYMHALPALRLGASLRPGDAEAVRVHACMSLIAAVEDTNLLYRGGAEGLEFARAQAAEFLARGAVAVPDWRAHAIAIHRAFVTRGLSPGGCADLLAMALFVHQSGD